MTVFVINGKNESRMWDERHGFGTNGSANRLHKLVETSGVLSRYGDFGVGS
jgi:hypothetical protein